MTMTGISTTGKQCLRPVQFHDIVVRVPCHIRYLATDSDGATYGFIGNRPFWNPVKGTWFNPKCTPQFVDTGGMTPNIDPNCSCVLVQAHL